MSGTRVQIDLYFDGKTPAEVNRAFPELLPAIKKAKAKASKINAGKENEEMTVKASYHICRHDEGKPCEPEVEI